MLINNLSLFKTQTFSNSLHNGVYPSLLFMRDKQIWDKTRTPGTSATTTLIEIFASPQRRPRNEREIHRGVPPKLIPGRRMRLTEQR